MGDDRLVKWVVVESGEMAGKLVWQKDLEQCLDEFDWRDVGVEGLGTVIDENRTYAERQCLERGKEGVRS